jgi:hypothetical protein
LSHCTTSSIAKSSLDCEWQSILNHTIVCRSVKGENFYRIKHSRAWVGYKVDRPETSGLSVCELWLMLPKLKVSLNYFGTQGGRKNAKPTLKTLCYWNTTVYSILLSSVPLFSLIYHHCAAKGCGHSYMCLVVVVWSNKTTAVSYCLSPVTNQLRLRGQ